MVEKARQQGFIFGEGDDAATDVAGREHIQFLAQAAARTAIVADRDHGTEFTDRYFAGNYRVRSCGKTLHGRSYVVLEPFEQDGEAGAAADGDNSQAGCGNRRSPRRRRSQLEIHHGGWLALLLGKRKGRGRIGSRVGIEQLGETGVFRQILKVGIVASLEAEPGS